MTIHNIFIGDINDGKFSWGENIKNDVEQDIPTRISDDFPEIGLREFLKVLEMIGKGFKGKQTGRGIYVVEVTKKQIEDFVQKNCNNVISHEKDLKKIKQTVKDLDDSKKYALIAQEF